MLTGMLVLAGMMATCEAVSGAAPLMRSGNIVLLGEIHGTAESPAAVSRLACLALERELGVTIALEIPVVEHERVEHFLTGGETADLLSGDFWSRSYQDGRSSAAMLELLATLRDLSGEGSLRVVLIDDPEAEDGRDRFMAKRIAGEVERSPERLLIALVGNLHNRLTRGTRFDPSYEPMGLRLEGLLPSAAIVSLQITHGGGSAWVCTGGQVSDCGARELSGRDGVAGIEIYEEEGAFSGRYHVGRIQASPPARLEGVAPPVRDENVVRASCE